MKLFAILIIIFLAPTEIMAQVAWLSTSESINQFREQVEAMKPTTSQYDVKVFDKIIQLADRELGIRVYKPKGDGPKPTLVYVHGACWVAGSLDSHDEICRYLSEKSDVNIIAINYRLAPENKYPAAHNDVYEATEWIWNHADELGVETDNFAIAGESTGAYFTAATVLKSKDTENSPKFSFQLLVYAALDGGGSSWSECKKLYFNNKSDVRSEYGSPLWSKNLSGLPPTYNILGEYEISRSEEELFMRKLEEKGVVTKSFIYAGVGHDVSIWASVSKETPAHLKAVEYIKAGFHIE